MILPETCYKLGVTEVNSANLKAFKVPLKSVNLGELRKILESDLSESQVSHSSAFKDASASFSDEMRTTMKVELEGKFAREITQVWLRS